MVFACCAQDCETVQPISSFSSGFLTRAAALWQRKISSITYKSVHLVVMVQALLAMQPEGSS